MKVNENKFGNQRKRKVKLRRPDVHKTYQEKKKKKRRR